MVNIVCVRKCGWSS